MSVIIEADEHSSRVSRSTAVGVEDLESNEEHVTSERHIQDHNSLLEHNEITEVVCQRQDSNEQQDGGAGDVTLEEDRVESIAASVKIKSGSTGSGYTKGSRGEGEVVSKKSSYQSDKVKEQGITSNVRSEFSGLNIVTQILDEILDIVVTNKEHKKNVETEEGSQPREDLKQYSVTTIKSVDEGESIEATAQLYFEREAAALQQQQIFQDNIALYNTHVALRSQLKIKNAFLLKRMYEHYKRKKIEHLFKDVPLANIDIEEKYVKVLVAYDDAQKVAQEEEIKTFKLVSTLEEKKESVVTDLNEEYNNFLLREREIAKGLLSAQSPNPQSEKIMEGLIQRQIMKSKEVAEQRLSYFKLRDITSGDEYYLKSLKHLGDNLTLMEYEQLKMQSQSCVEKLEERDAELHRLRCKATSAIQVLAEVREKTRTLQEDIEAGKVVLHDINQQLIQTRERLSCEKRRRDMSRSDAVRLRQEAGLLSEPKLLHDYRESLSEKENLLQQLQDWKEKYESQKQNILTLRRALAASQHKSTEENYKLAE